MNVKQLNVLVGLYPSPGCLCASSLSIETTPVVGCKVSCKECDYSNKFDTSARLGLNIIENCLHLT